jgi:hypothetical protein
MRTHKVDRVAGASAFQGIAHRTPRLRETKRHAALPERFGELEVTSRAQATSFKADCLVARVRTHALSLKSESVVLDPPLAVPHLKQISRSSRQRE